MLKLNVENTDKPSSSSGINFTMPKISTGVWVALGVVALIGVVLIVALVSASYQYVEWNEWSLRKNTASNDVDYSHVYGPGRYFWGVTYKPVTFEKTVNTVYFDDQHNGALVIFTDTGLEIQIACSFQYQLDSTQIPSIFNNYGDTYNQQVISVARSILKNAAPLYKVDQYYSQRDMIVANFTQLLADGLPAAAQVTFISFQLGHIYLADEIATKLLNIQVQLQVNLQEQYIQNAAVVRQYTNTLVAEIQANATQILAEGQANANLIVSRANSTAFSIREEARSTGLSTLYNRLNFTTVKQKLSFLYVTGLATTNARLVVDTSNALLSINNNNNQ